MGKLTISMAIFHSYFDITRGYSHDHVLLASSPVISQFIPPKSHLKKGKKQNQQFPHPPTDHMVVDLHPLFPAFSPHLPMFPHFPRDARHCGRLPSGGLFAALSDRRFTNEKKHNHQNCNSHKMQVNFSLQVVMK